MKPTRAGKAGLLVGSLVGAAGGALHGLKKIRSASEEGTANWNGRTALIVGGYALGAAALGGALGFATGELGDYYLAADGKKGIDAAVETGRQAAKKRGLEGDAAARFIELHRISAQEARAARIASPGNRLFWGRGEGMSLFTKNKRVDAASAWEIRKAHKILEEALELNSNPYEKAYAAFMEKNPAAALSDARSKLLTRRGFDYSTLDVSQLGLSSDAAEKLKGADFRNLKKVDLTGTGLTHEELAEKIQAQVRKWEVDVDVASWRKSGNADLARMANIVDGNQEAWWRIHHAPSGSALDRGLSKLDDSCTDLLDWTQKAVELASKSTGDAG